MHLGSFGTAVREIDPSAERDSFEFAGETFHVADTIPPMLMLQLGAAATGKIDDSEGLGAIWEVMRVSLTAPATEDRPADPAEFSRFYRLAVERKVDLPDLMRVAMALFEAQSGRPTERRPGSAPGPSETSTSSSTSSSTHPALAQLRPVRDVLAG